MPRKAHNEPIMLHSVHENTPKMAWERLEAEPAQWYLRFKCYCLMGRGRSLQAVLAQEKGLLQTEDEKGEVLPGAESEIIFSDSTSADETHFADSVQRDQERRAEQNRVAQMRGRDLAVVVPGSWKRASKRWEWVARAQAYDEQVRGEYEQALLSFLDHEGLYITKAQRLAALDMLASALMVTVHRIPDKQTIDNDLKPFLACLKQLQSVLKDIRKEMSSVDLEMVRRKP